MFSVSNQMSEKLEESIHASLNQTDHSDDGLFGFAVYDPDKAEKTGYSNYSYWGSTLRAFFKNRTAMFFCVVLVLLLTFTIIQPYLPNQYEPVKIINYPMTKRQISNIAPNADNKISTAPEGMKFIYKELPDFEGWYALTNVVGKTKAQKKFTVNEYGEEWLKVEFNGIEGYMKNDHRVARNLPDDVNAVPYMCRADFAFNIFSSPYDYTNPDPNSGGWVYTDDKSVILDGETLVTTADTQLFIYPSRAGFLFGTNIEGQDLWARVWSGTRTSLYIGFMVALVEAFVGILVGILWGYVRGLDRLLTEMYNVLDNIPTTIVLILMAFIMRPSVSTIIIAMCLTRWMGMARFIRNQIIIIRDRDYNIASRCLGAGTGQIMLKNLLPYMVSVIMLRMALAIPGAIGNEVFITYIGLGVPTDTPTLGNLINIGRQKFATVSLRYQLLYPTVVLSIITIAFYILGNAFADAADPKNHM